MDDLLKIIFPLVIQNIILDNIGSSKLKSAIISEIESIQDINSFNKFLLVFLYSDLRLDGFVLILEEYVKSVDSKDLLKIIFFKLMYYYRFRYFSPKVSIVIKNLLSEILLKLNKKSKLIHKSLYLSQIEQMSVTREAII